MRKKAEGWDHIVPLIYPQTYLRVAQERGADPIAILDAAGLSRDFIDNPVDIRMLQMQQVIESVLTAVGDNGLGIDVGWHLPPTAFGSFGYALLCSETARDVLKLTQRYWHLVTRGTDLTVREEDDICVVEVVIAAPFLDAVRALIFETTFSSIYRGFQLLSGASIEEVEIWFDFPAPAHAEKAASMLNNVRYEMPANQLRFPKHLLALRLGMHNPTGLKFALEQCELEDALAETGTNKTVALVRERMVFTMDGYPTLQEISQQLNMTARTMRRRLEQQGTNYKTLMEEAKRRDALRLLDNHDMDIQKVAELLGYNDPANFTRAFRQWTGQTPSQYRLTRRSG